MFRNYLKIAIRSPRKSKGFTALNIIGLAAGLGVCLLIVLYVTGELSYDRYNVNALVIALLTVSIQTIRAALANPIKSLRSE